MLKNLPIIVATLGVLGAPALADRGSVPAKVHVTAAAPRIELPAPKVAEPAPEYDATLFANIGGGYDLKRRDHKSQLPPEQQGLAKVHPLTNELVSKLVKVRHEEVSYCWDRLPASQRVAGTAVIHFSVDAVGAVSGVEVSGDAPSEAASCLSECAKRWAFAGVDTKSELDYAIHLK